MVPKIPIGQGVEGVVDWMDVNMEFLLDATTNTLDFFLTGFEDLLLFIPPLLLIAILGIIAYVVSRKFSITAVVVLLLLLVHNLRLWDLTVTTLSLVLMSTLICVAIGIPVGILSSKNMVVKKVITPILDFMQTMPSFVYLIPAVAFFGLGNVPGLVATVVFAMPPIIRLTDLGIRQVPDELTEVADSFGSTAWQKLTKVQIPVATPSIMAGVNQTIMLSLSMAVIAAMIGAKGLGYMVLASLQRVEIGMGFEAGLGIVIIAIVLDRITQSVRSDESSE